MNYSDIMVYPQLNELTINLMKFPSIYPDTKEIIEFLNNYLTNYGFECKIFNFNNSYHLYAEIGNSENIIGFAGHIDVVPTGADWKHPPFDAHIEHDILYGRGAVDMKPAIAAFIIAAINFYKSNPNCKICLIIAGDEEVTANQGTAQILEWMELNNKKADLFIVGEPTNPNHMGEMIKIGRRGSISFKLHIIGKQGHVAYPANASNPCNHLSKILAILNDWQIDIGNENFDPSNLEIVNIETSTKSFNVIPQTVIIGFNIRFNNEVSVEQLIQQVTYKINQILNESDYKLEVLPSANVFINHHLEYIELITQAIEEQYKIKPIISTTGGTSDARFIAKYFPVIEYGLINKTAHQVDEHISLQHISQLYITYNNIITNYFKKI